MAGTPIFHCDGSRRKLLASPVAAAFALALAFLALVALSSAGAPAASAASCRHAKASPKAISTRHAKHAVICLLNRRRHSAGLSRLHVSNDLNQAARRHSRHMESSGCFDHDCPGEPTVESRLRRSHYLVSGLTRWMYGENIAWGGDRRGSPANIVDAWMHSPDHRANILNPAFDDLGVGVTWGTPGNPHGDGGIYTTDFGMRQG